MISRPGCTTLWATAKERRRHARPARREESTASTAGAGASARASAGEPSPWGHRRVRAAATLLLAFAVGGLAALVDGLDRDGRVLLGMQAAVTTLNAFLGAAAVMLVFRTLRPASATRSHIRAARAEAEA